MSINLKVYNKIGYEDVHQGMTLRIVTDGPGIKSDVEGTVKTIFQGYLTFPGPVYTRYGYDTVTFRDDPSMTHIVKYPAFDDKTVELYEVIDAIPDEPKGVGAVVRIVDCTRPGRTMEAVKTGRKTSRAWVGKVAVMSWEEIMSCVLSRGYDYIEVLSEGVEL